MTDTHRGRSCVVCGKSPALHPLPSQLKEWQKAANRRWADNGLSNLRGSPHWELPPYGCEAHAFFRIGDRVRFLVRDFLVREDFGIIVALVSDESSYMVRPEGESENHFIWTIYELEHAPLRPLRFERQEPI